MNVSGTLSKLNNSMSGALSNRGGSISGELQNENSVSGKLHIGGGSVEGLGALAYKDTASGSYTPKGTVSVTSGTSVTKTIVAASPESSAPNNSITYYRMNGENLALYQLGYTTGDLVFNGTKDTITVS
jgi:hypothetical protein